jgi:Immunoglobulin I-set domain
MNSKKLRKLPALLVALGLQVLPFCRTLQIAEAAAPSAFSVILRWIVGASAVMGTMDAVSAASAVLQGVANTSPPGPVSTNASGAVGKAFSYRIIVTNPGLNPQQAFWNASPLPPGLSINTNLGGNGFITGSPTSPGVFHTTLTAGNANYALVLTKDVTITITGGSSPPTITTPLANQSVNAGANVNFTVGAAGSGTLTYAWYFGTSPISGASTATLSLPSVTSGNAGTYSVVVTDSAGSVTNSASLAVLSPPTITSPLGNQSVNAGANVSFTVGASGSGTLAFAWYFGASPIPSASTATLSLPSVTSGNVGTYSVVVSNAAGSVTNSATLAVLSPPTITTPLANQSVNAGANVTFTVGASGSGTLAYAWYFGTSPIPSASTATLSLPSVTSASVGTYSVVVSNAAGSVTNSATLAVATSATAITTQPVSQIATAGANVTLSVVATGSNLSYQWRRGSSNLPAATAASLVLNGVTPAQSGVYSVVVTGSGGAVPSADATLLVVNAPAAADAPAVSITAPDAAHLGLSFTTAPGYAYSLQTGAAANAATWTVVSNFPAAFTGGPVTVATPNPSAAAAFFRVLVSSN